MFFFTSSSSNRDRQHCIATASLCLSSLANAYATASVSPYAGYMVLYLIPNNATTENAGKYSGWLVGMFHVGRLLTSYMWGSMADQYGRISTLQCCLLSSVIINLLFGISKSFYNAIIWRFILGMAQGGVFPIIQTLASEIISITTATTKTTSSSASSSSSDDDDDNDDQQQKPEIDQNGDCSESALKEEEHDGSKKSPGDDNNNSNNKTDNDQLLRQTMGWVVAGQAFGVVVSPAISGFLAEPTQQYSSFRDDGAESSSILSLPSWLASLESWLYKLLDTYPFLLPNVLGAILCAASGFFVHVTVDETLPADKRRDPRLICSDCIAAIKQIFQRKQQQQQRSLDWSNEETSLVSESQTFTVPSKSPTIWERPLARQHLWTTWVNIFISIFVNEAFPLFCMSTLGGLSMKESAIGSVLMGAGAVYIVLQYPVYAYVTRTMGLYEGMLLSGIVGSVFPSLIPISLLFRQHSIAVLVFLSLIFGATKLMVYVFFSSVAVAGNKTVDATQRATLNAWWWSIGGGACKGVGTVFAGSMTAFSYSGFIIPPRYGSLLTWTLTPMMGTVVAILVCRLKRKVSQAADTTEKASRLPDPAEGE